MSHLHQRIRAEIESRIMSGEWAPGHRVPSEHELAAGYGCSRMTVSKVLSGLAAQGLVTRRRRAGSVVAAPSTERAMLEIQDLAQEAARQGRAYRFAILSRGRERLDPGAARRLGLPVGTEMLRVHTLHLADEVPSAHEERLIHLAAVPEAADELFRETPPGTWLLRRVPWSVAEHAVRAVNAEPPLARLLGIAAGAACLVLERRTWQGGVLVTEARLIHPGDRHHLSGRFSPVAGGVG